ncbi:MAG: mechanosensitive ion channel [Candidatus Limnocylindria bacterium]
MDTTPITDMGDAVLVAVADALRNFLGFLPQLVGALIVLIIGWIVAGLLARLVEGALKAIGFERAAESSGIAGFIRQSGAGAQWTASRVVAEIVKWFIRLIALQAAAAILGMPQLTAIINSILLFLPNVVVALAIVVVGALIAKFVGGLVRGATSEMGFGNPDLVASIARYAIIVFAVIAAINQLGIAPTVVNTLFIATVGAVAAAFALAFGLGGREVAAQITQSWYSKGQEASQRVAEYAQRKQADQQRVQSAGEALSQSATARPRPSDTPPNVLRRE